MTPAEKHKVYTFKTEVGRAAFFDLHHALHENRQKH